MKTLLSWSAAYMVAITGFTQDRSSSSASSETIDLRSHAFRSYGGRVYDFSAAIRWFANAPPRSSPYPSGSPLHAEWEDRWNRHSLEGLKWGRFLVGGVFEKNNLVLGTIVERRTEGIIINMPAVMTVQTGSGPVGGRMYGPLYSTVATTRQVLLRGVPSQSPISPPVFAIPAGTSSIAGASVETFDYGIPTVQPMKTQGAIPQIPPLSSTNLVTITNSSPKAASDAKVLKYYSEKAEKGDAYAQYRMGLRYLRGDGVETDPQKAREYFSKSAAQGQQEAAVELARLPAP
jgi:hypothetical protein